MGYFASFLIFHIYFRQKFATTGFWVIDQAWRMIIYLGLATWAGTVAYSRLYLSYHTSHQIIWGFLIGIGFGTSFYIATELIPRNRPLSILGQIRSFELSNPISEWFRVRDGWMVWRDGGREEDWKRWKLAVDKKRAMDSKKTR